MQEDKIDMDEINDIYSPPQSELAKEEAIRPSIWLVLIAILLTFVLISILVLKVSQFAIEPTLIPLVLGSIFPACLFVLIFQIWKRFRNSRSRWKIYSWCQFIFILGQISSLLQVVGSNA